MRLCIYEDSGASWLEPITLTRPAFALWCGAERLFERHCRQFAAQETGFWVRPALAALWKLEQPHQPVNDGDWLRRAATVWINGRWLPAPEVHIDSQVPHVGVVGKQIAYAVLPEGIVPATEALDAFLNEWKQRLPNGAVKGTMLDFLWDAIHHNGDTLRMDANWFRSKHKPRPLPEQVAIQGPFEQFIVADNATIEPFVFADTRKGPVMIDHGAIIHAFSRLEGPCYVGKDSWIVGAKLRQDSTIGPWCRVGGEVEGSIVQGFSNKYHEGFLGHSYLGEWVNLAAATQTSDLRNDYGEIKVTMHGQRMATGHMKVGSFIGDHSKTGLAALLNTGTIVGAFAGLLPSGSLLPTSIPSFCLVQSNQLQEQWDLRKLFQTASRVMQRRDTTLTEVHKDFYYSLFETTAKARELALREGEVRRLRRSV